MNTILGMAYLALQTELDVKQKNYVEKVHRSAENLLGILNDILDFSKIESGKMALEETGVHLEDLRENVINLIGLSAQEKGLSLEFHIDPDVPPTVIGDPLRLGQILVNLGNNAVKFTQPGGNVDIGIKSKQADAGTVELDFSVRDTGIGLTQQQKSRLFQPFSQGDSSTTREFGGSGLGLAISQNLAELMGGAIWVESEFGKGSTFHFTAWLKRPTNQNLIDHSAEKPSCQAAAETVKNLCGARILLEEDNKLNQELAYELLVGNGREVEIANNGADALELLAKRTFDAVLMDCQMPVMDGYKATRKIREDERFRDLPIIAMTASVVTEDRQRVQDAGMSDHLGKPVDVGSMLKTLGKWIKTRPDDKTDQPGMTHIRKGTKQMTSQHAIPVPELPGVNRELGLSYIQGNTALYARVLKNFLQGHRNFERDFHTARLGPDPEVARRMAHTLKSTAGYLGAEAMQQAAADLEIGCGDNLDTVEIEQRLQRVLAELNPVITALESLNPDLTDNG